MEPHSNMTPGLHLPQPSVAGNSSASQEMTTPPQVSTPSDFSGRASVYTPRQAAPDPPATTISAQATAQVSQGADQTDELDKEWIAKAKFIVEQTKGDPYAQTKELGKIKADYLRIRYNKHIKISPDKTS